MAALLFVSRKIILSSIFFLFINIFMQIHHHISADPIIPIFSYCDNGIGNYTKNSKFQSNLNTIISSISSKINSFGFYNNTAGDSAADQVNAVAYCRGDMDIESCRACLNDAARNLILLCPNQMEAIRWYDECMFRYSNKKILGVMSIDPGNQIINGANVSIVDSFSRELPSLAGDLANQAYNGDFRKYAGLKTTDPNGQTIFGLMQCSPDISPNDCMSCLQTCENFLSPTYFRKGARQVTPSCTFRYEIYSFLKTLSNPPPPPPLLPSSPPPPPPTGKSKTVVVVVCTIVAMLVLITLIWVCVFFTKRRWKNTSRGHSLNDEEEELEGIGDRETRQYDFALIRVATNDFSTANLLGRGGFGDVYKGVLSDGKEIAVKRLSTTSVQGENEFRNEVILLAKLQHKCLVRLLGFCLENVERLLVYEFMANGSLNNVLFDVVNRSELDWGMRYKIINNIAKGLLYLHEDSRLMIIHRDLKASNILLDREMNAKISDFGTARLFVWDESVANTIRIAGTMGYMSPEYVMHGSFSVKSDVYSFGVLFLEILTGKRNNYSLTEDSSEGLLSYAYKTWKDGRALDLIDPVLKMAHTYTPEIIIRCIHIALLCVQENVGSRPTMATVLLMLQSLTMTMPLPSEPGFFSSTWLRPSEFNETKSTVSTSKSHESKRLGSQSKFHESKSLVSGSKSVHASGCYDTSFTDDDSNSDLYPR